MKTHLLKLNREKRKRTLIHPQMGMNQNPAQRQKGWGLVRKGPTCKNKHRRTILPKTNENSTEASSSNRINLEQRRLMTEGQDKKGTLSKEKTTEEELNHQQLLENY